VAESKRVRKPRGLVSGRSRIGLIDTTDSVGLPICLCTYWVSLRTAKRVRDWLTRAIAWIEDNPEGG